MATTINMKNCLRVIFLLLLFFHDGKEISAQGTTYNYFYRVYFKDKGNQNPDNYPPNDLISPRAQKRRQKAGIVFPDLSDLPVNPDYINQAKSKGFILHCTSKWMNTGLFKTVNLADINSLLGLQCIKDVRIVKKPAGKSAYSHKLDLMLTNNDLPPYDRPITLLNGQALHNSGYNGSGLLIAVLDGGFINADVISSLSNLRARKGIKGTRDMIMRTNSVYNYHNHGTAVLSVLAGDLPGIIAGTAPGSDFWLIRTEDTSSEFPVEEDYWAAGAEFADSAGVDIISSSLGYSTFDDASMDYKFSSMDGNTAFVTKAADMAASKGIVVVNSAGNERTSTWKRIIAPSDGKNVIAAGAVDGDNFISVFSSAGPSADRRIKPDNTTQGVSVTVQVNETSVSRANGTSFSCPVLSGMCACAMQAVPEALNTNIMEALHKNADRYSIPDSLYGYGTPDMTSVLKWLQDIFIIKPDNETTVGPNPFIYDFEIIFKNTPGSLKVIISNSSGKIILNREYEEYIGRTLKINSLQNQPQGIYFIKLITSSGSFSHKVIKLKE
jgi:serine protease AprX